MVDIDPLKLQANGLDPVGRRATRLMPQNLTLPSGLAKIGNTQYTVRTNAMPTAIADLNERPIKYVNGQTVFMRDVGQVHDGWAAEHGAGDGRRTIYPQRAVRPATPRPLLIEREFTKPSRSRITPRSTRLSINKYSMEDSSTTSITGVFRRGRDRSRWGS